MQNAEWTQVDDLLDAALDLDPAARREFLNRSSATSELLREVESLLAGETEMDGFLAAPALALSSDFFEHDVDPDDHAGQSVGRYRIIREIGRGGMGAVFLAERSDGEFQQQLALKIVRRSFADSDLARRFRQERQILASLNHPNIARLIDGGVSEDGEPFLAMEYVEGVRIDDYCDTHGLSIDERLQVFLAVCRGVAYAHQNLIVHRDIKPSNILVTKDGVPKLLDFGIAKLVNPEVDHGSAETVTGLRAMTLDYASPEQVLGVNVTTASDVYSLGVLLYELLTGQRPHSLKNLRTDDIARIICQEEPEKPSNARSEPPAVAGGPVRRDMPFKRKTGPPATTTPAGLPGRGPRSAGGSDLRSLRGDLDNIVLMAMRKEPQRRYASVAQFAEDVNRYLEGRPVLAHKDTFTYRAKKFVWRHKAAGVAVALVLMALVAGVTATVWQARRATAQARIAAQERDRARLEAAKAERINDFMQSIFASADPNWYSLGYGQRGEVKVVDVLEQAGRRIDTELKDEPEIRAELHHTIGTTYQSLGHYDQAHTHFGAALDTYRGLYGERHPEVAEAIYYLAASTLGRGDSAGALALLRQSLEMFRQVDPNNANVPYLLHDLSNSLSGAGESAAAENSAREGLELARRKYGNDHSLTLALVSILGLIHERRGDLRQAEIFYQTVLSTFNRMPNGKMQSRGSLESLGHLSMLKGDFKQAEAQYREALDISITTQNETHPYHINLMLRRAEIHYLQGAYADAEKVTTSALDLIRRAPSTPLRHQLRGLSLLSVVHAKTNRRARAAAFLREALTLFNQLSDDGRYEDDGLLGEALVAMKSEADARPWLQKRYDFFAGRYGEQNPQAIISRKQLERLDAARSR
jgi:serine/threonine protein kinase/tetratricopeptide (TPR) repeat protein